VSRIVMAMSGGVDSSVAAALLRRAGHDVIGVFMRHGEREPAQCGTNRPSGATTTSPAHPLTRSPVHAPVADARGSLALPIVQPRLDHKQGCCSATDAEDARRVADALEIPFYALNLSDDFARIIDYFVDEYSAARTPNPCVMCNNWLKFGKLFEYADSVGAEFVATGHYAQIRKAEGGIRKTEKAAFSPVAHDGPDVDDAYPALHRGLDHVKDQSYVLFGVARHFLPRMLFPLGGYRKPEIRALAHEFGLRVADKRDSQEICFVASGDHADFVRRRRANENDENQETAGDIALADGTIVGRHDGIEGFTIGQRKGLRVAMGEPYYVTRIDAATRQVMIGRREELARRELAANRVNWLIEPPNTSFRAHVQIRYNSTAAPALVEPQDDGRFRVHFDDPRYGIAPGQAAVCYDGDCVLGGGWIE
jgi:tRNA-uridine 2-sulfurtransferase